ncbi:MAG: ribosome silencing factor [Nitrospinota bacterium]|nr:ribosome silencing factor [Nitrospinota bacterium]MDH5757401.1 ribosome silencing factor [Nitrospinota bacterium]
MTQQTQINAMEKYSLCYNSAVSKKALDPVAFDVRGVSDVADVFMIVSGSSNRQIKAIVDSVEETLREAGEKSYHIEGYDKAWWVLVDAGDVVIHVFSEEARTYYDLESYWSDAKRILPEDK